MMTSTCIHQGPSGRRTRHDRTFPTMTAGPGKAPCRRPCRRAFTLLEVLLVLAMVVVLAGLAWPALRSSMAKSRLRDSAQQLRVELARTRLAAMECGVPLEFRYREGEGRFRIAAQRSADESDSEINSSPHQHGSARSKSPLSRKTATDARFTPPASETTLPEGVVFAAPQAPSRNAESSADEPVETFEEDSWQQAGWSAAIVFHPDGTASDAVLALSNGEGSQVTVQLRGVTGLAKPGNVESSDETKTSDNSTTRQFKTAREDNAPLMR